MQRWAASDEVPVIGRDQDLAVLSQLLLAARDGPVSCVIRGVAGIGKTTVWNMALAVAGRWGYRVMACRPTQSESRLAFAGLGDLLDRTPDPVVEQLPAPLRRALEVALLRTSADGLAPNHRAVGVALLEVIRTLAKASPVVVAIDDVQWLDPATATAVEHVVRRLMDEPVAMLTAVRDDDRQALPLGFAADKTVQIDLGGLSLGALHRLIRTRTGLTLSRPVLRQVEHSSGGNPFYALQIAQTLSQTNQWPRPGEQLPIPKSLSGIAAVPIQQLSATARKVLAAVAMLAQPTVALVQAALHAPDELEALALAEERGIIEVSDGRIRFAHPLFAATAYSALPSIRRQRLHARLSNVVGDAEQRAWHLALSGQSSDAGVAAALQEAALRAHARGACSLAAQLWELAAQRTPEELTTQRLIRTAAAGTVLFHAGDAARARELLQTAATGLLAGRERAGALLDLADVVFHEGGSLEAAQLCEQALTEAGDDRKLRIVAGVRGAWYRTHDPAGQLRCIEAAADLLRDDDISQDPELHTCVMLMLAYYRFYNGLGFDRESLNDAYDLAPPDSLSWKADWARMTWRSFTKLIDVAKVRAAYADEYELFRSVGDESAMATLLTHMSEVDCWLGNWHEARDRAERSLELLEQCGQRRWRGFALYAMGLAQAHLGELDTARAAAAEGLELATLAADPWVSVLHLGLLGFIDLSAGDAPSADHHLTRAAEMTDGMGLAEPGRHRFHADQFEAAVMQGDLDRAAVLLGRLRRRVAAAPYPWLLTVTARCEGLLLTARGDLDGAAAAMRQALLENERLPMPFELARTLLTQGRLLRRRKEKLAARAALLDAQKIFDELGAALWSAQAAEELRRLGLRRGAIGELTPTEERIARLVVSGLTNREVAAVAFVSIKTVEANLSRIYRKLGVHSRRELSRLDLAGQL